MAFQMKRAVVLMSDTAGGQFFTVPATRFDVCDAGILRIYDGGTLVAAVPARSWERVAAE